MANRIARAILARLGQGPEPVAILFEQGMPGIAALQVLKSGKFFALIDSSFPQGRIANILEDSQAALVLTNTQNLALTTSSAEPGAQVIDVDHLDDNLPDDNPGRFIPPNAIAYIIYTSGSTDRAKGVIQSHRNLLYHIMNRINGMHMCVEDRWSLLSWGTARTIKNIFCSVLTGTALFAFNAREEGVVGMAPWLNREKLTLVHASGTLYRSFIGTLTGLEQFPHIRLIRLAGQTITPADFEFYQKHFSSHCTFINLLRFWRRRPLSGWPSFFPPNSQLRFSFLAVDVARWRTGHGGRDAGAPGRFLLRRGNADILPSRLARTGGHRAGFVPIWD